MHTFIFITGAVMLGFHYLIESDQILNTFGWCGVILGAVFWWRETNPKNTHNTKLGRPNRRN